MNSTRFCSVCGDGGDWCIASFSDLSGNAYGSNNGGFVGDNQSGGNPVGNSSQFDVSGEAQFDVSGEAQFGSSMEKPEMYNGPVGDFEDDTDVAKRA
ncbi:hypothetical protein Bca52824_022229 [Brassica carinata]|uniref:Uncharacterized protein n=1 Tax=Brassica carinata TaxID=52824 RepID=A0A8X8ASU5_BRACI|nr:hypothetical protein Bca52824_022229 [Brassica carinata]